MTGLDGTIALMVVVVFVVAGWLAFRLLVAQNRKNRRIESEQRTESVARWASAHGWTYAANDDRYARMPWGAPFDDGNDRPRATDVLTGQWYGRPVICFNYRYSERRKNYLKSGYYGSSAVHYETEAVSWSVFAVRLPQDRPNLQVSRRRGLGDGLIEHATGVNRVLLGDDAFDSLYTVTGDDEGFARALLQPPIRALVARREVDGFTIAGSDVVTTGRASEVELDEIESVFAALAQVADAAARLVPR